jgi:hypothetical protein
MPGLNVGLVDTALAATPLDATLVARSRRRVWVHPELTSHSLLTLTADRLYLAPLAGDPKPEVVTAIEAGADLDDIFGPLAVVIDLVSVRRMDLDLLTNSLTIEYVGTGYGTARQRLTFATPEAADACFTKVWRRLGKGFELAPFRADTWSAVRAPLLLLLGALAATALLVLLLSIFADMSAAREASRVAAPGLGELGVQTNIPKSPLEVLLGWLDWRVVCGVGGVVAAISQVWLYRRLTTPPSSLKLIQNT